MNAALLDLPIETPETLVSCVNCPAVQRLERALDELRANFRREMGYWKSQHANAFERIEQLKEELDQSRGQTRVLQDKLFSRKSEKSSPSDHSSALFDPEELTAPSQKARRSARWYGTWPTRLFPPARGGRVRLAAGGLAGVFDVRKACHDYVGHRGFGSCGDRCAGARAVELMRVQAAEELSDPKLRQPCRKTSESLQEHGFALTGSTKLYGKFF